MLVPFKVDISLRPMNNLSFMFLPSSKSIFWNFNPRNRRMASLVAPMAHPWGVVYIYPTYIGVSKNKGIPKMDGENNGKPY